MRMPNSAQTDAEEYGDEKAELEMSKDPVESVETYPTQASASGHNSVRTPVRLDYARIKRIDKLPSEPVYNLEVDNYHNFSVCNGLIVHNCIDAVRYASFPIWRRRGE